MNRIFEKWPDELICPVCGTSAQKPCVLVAIVGTEEGDIIQSVPIHVQCALPDYIHKATEPEKRILAFKFPIHVDYKGPSEI